MKRSRDVTDMEYEEGEAARRRDSRALGQRSNKGVRPISRLLRWVRRGEDDGD